MEEASESNQFLSVTIHLPSNSQPGVRVPPGGTQAVRRGYVEFQIYQNKQTKGKQKGAWGYAKEVNFDLGVCEVAQY